MFSNMRTSCSDLFHRILSPKGAGRNKVLACLCPGDCARVVELLMEQGANVRLPHSRAFGEGLFELRPKGRSGIGRAFYCFLVGKRVVVLHAFIKKSQQTPDQELKLARKRMKEIVHG